MNKLIPLLAFSILFLGFLGSNQEAEAASMTFTTDTTITTDMTIAAGETWTINPGVTLTINPGVTVAIDLGGVIDNDGTINNNGDIFNGGFIDNDGTINNSDDIINTDVNLLIPGQISNVGGIINNSGAIDTFSGTLINGGGIINNSGIITEGSDIDNLGGTINNFCNGTIGGDPPDPLGTINQIPCSPEICDNFLDDDGNGLVDGDDPACQAVSQIIGGKIIPIESTSLILAGAQSFSWMIPVMLSGIGIGLVLVRRK